MLETRAPLPPGWILEAEGLRVRALEPAPAFELRADAVALQAACAALGLAAPAPCGSAQAGGRAVLWLGPDALLLLGEPAAPEFETARLGAALAGRAHALVETTGAEAALELEGSAAADLLSCAVMLDLDAGAFPAGACARTLFGKAPALLWRPESARFVLRTPRSCARYALGLLKAGAAGL